MPDREVHTIRDLIFYQYAKIIARRAFGCADGVEAKRKNYGFIKKTFRELDSGQKLWSDITREDWQLVESDRDCAYCGSAGELQREHIVPKSLHIKPECATCDKIQSIHNQVLSCQACNLAKGTKGLYQFYKERLAGVGGFFDYIPILLEKKYLKTIYNCHECAGTLNAADPNGTGRISVEDIDCIIK